MIFVGSSVWIDYFNGKVTEQTDLLDSLPGRAPVKIAGTVQGAGHSKSIINK